MDLKEIKARIEEIKSILAKRGDNEVAHIREDGLYIDLLRSIADNECKNPAKCAKEALKAADINYERWYT